jgi:uncharacterized membrane protein
MTTFSVWTFDDPDGAIRAASVLEQAEAEGLVRVADHAVVSWPVGEGQPLTRQRPGRTTLTGTTGTVCGVLVGALFTFPLVGGVVGGAIAALSQRSGVALTCADIQHILADVVPGTSALFAVTDQGDPDVLRDRLHWSQAAPLVQTELSDVQPAGLLDSLGRS